MLLTSLSILNTSINPTIGLYKKCEHFYVKYLLNYVFLFMQSGTSLYYFIISVPTQPYRLHGFLSIIIIISVFSHDEKF